MPALRRAVASLSRRLGRPELLAAFYPGAREALREEVALIAVLAAGLRDDGLYVDVGTNRGQVLREAVRVAPSAHHIAFEPIPGLAAELRRELPSVDCRELAIDAEPGEARFCHFRSLDGWSGLRRSPEISDERGDPEYLSVSVSTLDAELAGLSPTLVKIDVEGAELGVLEGGRELLARARPLVIFEHVPATAEPYGTSSRHVWEQLDALRYAVFTITGQGPLDRAAFAGDAARGVVNWLARPL
jgi:FkbM family methyltransferase